MTTKTILIDGEKFDVSAPYAEGHTVTAAEARVLNQTRAENIGNNFRKAVKEAKEKGESLDAVRGELTEYDAKYNFSMGGSTRTPIDPVEREARSIAKDAIKAKLAKDGRAIKDVDPEKLEAAIEVTSQREDIIKMAKARVAAKKKVSEVELGDVV